MKKLLTSLFVVFVGVFLLGFLSVKAEGVLVESVDGASIRTEGTQGLRFYAKLADGIKPADVSEHGFYLVYGKWTLAELEALDAFTSLTVNDKDIYKVPVLGFTSKGEFSVVLTGIPVKGYMDTLTVIPYAVAKDETEITKVSPVTRSIGEVAIALKEAAPAGIIEAINDNFVRVGFVGDKLEIVKGVEDVVGYEFYYNPTKITFPEALDKEGYNFLYYKLDELTYESGSEVVFDESLSGLYELVYEKIIPRYTVIFEDDGVVVKEESLLENEPLILPEKPVKAGYEFLGWYVGDKRYNASSLVKGDLTLVAKWQLDNYKVSFNTDGGSEISAISNLKKGDKIAKPEDPVKPGYKFVGWYKDLNFFDLWDFHNDTIVGSMSLYANYEQAFYDILVYHQDELYAEFSGVFYDENINDMIDWDNSQYAYKGLYKDASFIKRWIYGEDVIYEDITLYILLVPLTEPMSNVYFYYDGELILEAEFLKGYPIMDFYEHNLDGYTFAGWYLEAEYLTEWDLFLDVSDEDLNLYAKLIKNEYKIKIVYNLGFFEEVVMYYEEDFSSIPLKEIAGYSFAGLFYEKDHYSELDLNEKVYDNGVFYAKYIKDIVEVTYYDIENLGVKKYKVIDDYEIFITEDGRIWERWQTEYNEVEKGEVTVYKEIEVSLKLKEELLAGEVIVDVFYSKDKFVYKTSLGNWFIVKNNEVDNFLGLFDLTSGEEITKINVFDNLFIVTTSENRIFYYGTIRLFGQALINYQTPTLINFSLLEGEEFEIRNYSSSAEVMDISTGAVIYTNQRILVPAFIVKLFFNLSQEEAYIDISDLDDRDYYDACVQFYGDGVGLLLYESNEVYFHLMNDAGMFFQKYVFDFAEGEYVTCNYGGMILITNFNNLYSVFEDAKSEFVGVIDGEIIELYYSPFDQNNIIVKTSLNKVYYIKAIGVKFYVEEEITDVVAGYVYDGFWTKDNKAYYYDYYLEEFVLVTIYGLSKNVISYAGGDYLEADLFTNAEFLFAGWDKDVSRPLAEDMTLYPSFYYKDKMFDIGVDIYYGEELYEETNVYLYDEIATLKDLEKILNSYAYDRYEIYLGEVLLGKNDVVSVGDGVIKIVLFKERVNVVVIYKDIDGNFRSDELYGVEELDLLTLSYNIGCEVIGVYLDEELTVLFTGVLSDEMELYLDVSYNLQTVSFILPDELGTFNYDINIYDRYDSSFDYLFEELNSLYEGEYLFIDLYIDPHYEYSYSENQLEKGKPLYVKLGKIRQIEVVVGEDSFTESYVEGFYLYQYRWAKGYNSQAVIGVYLDDEYNQLISYYSVIPADVEVVYLKLCEEKLDKIIITKKGFADLEIILTNSDDKSVSQALIKEGLFIDYGSVLDLYGNYIGQIHYGNFQSYNQTTGPLYINLDESFLINVISEELSFVIYLEDRWSNYLDGVLYEQLITVPSYELTEIINGFSEESMAFNKVHNVYLIFTQVDVLNVKVNIDGEVVNFMLSNNYPFYEQIDYFVNDYLISNDITFKYYEYYLDSNYNYHWYGDYIRDLKLYLKIVRGYQKDLEVYILDDSFIISDYFVGDEIGYSLEEIINNYLLDHKINAIIAGLYSDSDFDDYFDGLYLEELENIYVSLDYYYFSDVTFYMLDETLLVGIKYFENSWIYFFKEPVQDYIYDLIDENEIKDIGLYLDSLYQFPFEPNFVEAGDVIDIYVKIEYYEYTNITIHVLDEEVVLDNVIVGENSHWEARNVIYDYLEGKGINYYGFDIFKDSEYEEYWDGLSLEALHVYVKVYGPIEVTIYILDDEIIISDVNDGNYGYYVVEEKISCYIESFGPNPYPYQVFTDSEYSNLWDNYFHEGEDLYVVIEYLEKTNVTIYILDEILVLENVFVGHYNGYIVYVSIDNYLNDLGINHMGYDIFIDSEHKNYWDGYYAKDLHLYSKVHELVDVIINISGDEVILESVYTWNYGQYDVEEKVGEHLLFKEINNYEFSVYTDSEYNNLWDNYFHKDEVLYVKVELLPTTSVNIYVSGDVIVLEEVVIGAYGWQEVERIVNNYTDSGGPNPYPYQVYTDSEYNNLWDNYFHEGEDLYVVIEYLEKTNVTIYVLDETLVLENVFVGYFGWSDVTSVVSNYIYDLDIDYNGLDYSTDSEHKNLWNNIYYKDLQIYVHLVKIISITFHILDDEVILDEVYSGYNGGAVYSRIDEYLFENEIEYQSYDIYYDSEYNDYWNGFVCQEMYLYVLVVTTEE